MRLPLPARSALDALDEVEKAPTLVLAQRARLHEADHVAHLAVVFLVMDLEPIPAANVLAVVRVLHEPLDLSHYRLLHGRADDRSGHHFPVSTLLRGRRCLPAVLRFWCHFLGSLADLAAFFAAWGAFFLSAGSRFDSFT